MENKRWRRFFYLHLEPQGSLDVAFPARMLGCCADIWEYILSKEARLPSKKGGSPLLIKQVALFIFPEDENKVSSFNDFHDGDLGISYSYKILRVWEMDKEVVLEKKLLSLYPLLPLMKEKLGKTPEQVMEETVRVIEEVEDVSLRANLFTALSILVENPKDSALIREKSSREMLMGSELFKEWTDEEKREVVIGYSKDTLLVQLKAKYGDIPKDVEDSIMKIRDQDTLNDLLVQIIRTTNLDEFLVKVPSNYPYY